MAKSNKAENEEQPDSALVLAPPSSALAAYMNEDNSMQGFEQTDATDYVVPRIILLQPNSPSVAEGKNQAGELIDSVSRQLLATKDTDFRFIPIVHTKQWIEWHPADSGLGIKEMSLDPNSRLARRARAYEKGPDGKFSVTEYHNFVVLIPGLGDGFERKPYVLSFARSNYNHGRTFLTVARQRGDGRAPLWSTVYGLNRELKSKDKWRWYEMNAEPLQFIEDGVIESVSAVYKTFAQMLKDQSFKIDLESDEERISEDEDSSF